LRTARPRLTYWRAQDASQVFLEAESPYRDGSIPPAFKTRRGALFNCDCMQLLRSLKDDSIDCIFADPPFNLGKDYGHKAVNDALDKKAYLDWCYTWLEESCRVLKPGGALFVYILPQWAFHFATFLDQHLEFRHWIAVSMKGTFPRGRKLYPAHYALLYFTKGAPRMFNRDDVRVRIPTCRHCGKDIKDYGGHRKYLNPKGLNLTDLWDDTSPNRHRKFKVRKINELKPMIPERAIRMATTKGDIVLDPFGGGGSTYQVAEQCARLWIGSEIADITPIADRLSSLLSAGSPPSRLRDVFREARADFSFRAF
jgi:site-specific DNA-methyltransferase (adenine-specific)